MTSLDSHYCESSYGYFPILDRLDRSEKNHLGVGQLRRFLEELLQKRYLENVPSIVPLLEKEGRSVQARLEALKQEIAGLDQTRLREKVGDF